MKSILGVIVNHNTNVAEACVMILSRKHLPRTARSRLLLPALAFVAFASLSAAGGGALAALCLLPAGLALEVGKPRDDVSES